MSILNSIKKMLGIDADFTAFDVDILVGINTAFMYLNQIGVGPSKIFSIEGPNEIWTDFIPNIEDFSAVKTYIYLRTRLFFDPPASSFVLDSLNNQLKEAEWRLKTQGEVE